MGQVLGRCDGGAAEHAARNGQHGRAEQPTDKPTQDQPDEPRLEPSGSSELAASDAQHGRAEKEAEEFKSNKLESKEGKNEPQTDDEEDWAVQYQNYCIEKEAKLKEMDEQEDIAGHQ